MSINKVAIVAGVLFLALGASLLYDANNSSPIINKQFKSQTYQAKPQSSEITGNPNELLIPSLDMNLSVIPGYYNPDTKTWNLSLDKVQYAETTPKPNNLGGATFFYGHYRREVFAYLHLIQPDAEAVVKTDNNHTFYYQLASIRTTTPTDDSVFKYSGPPVLIIQTCTGAFFQYRQFYTFNLVKVV